MFAKLLICEFQVFQGVTAFISIIWIKDCSEIDRDQARGRLGLNSGHRGQSFALNGTQGEVGVSLKKYFFFRETHFHSVTTQTQAVVTIYYHCIMFLLPLNGNRMCNG